MESEPEITTKRVTFNLQNNPTPTPIDNDSLSAPETNSSPSKHKLNERGSYGNKSSPNRNPSPKKRKITRDTLNGRLRKRIGKRGSRKFHRWENEKILGRREDELSDTGPAEDEMELYLFDENCQNIFYQMFENPTLRSAWAPYLDITEEEEQQLRNSGFYNESDSDEDTHACQRSFKSLSQIGYQRITSDGRQSINKYMESDFLDDLDRVIFDFVHDDGIQEESKYFKAAICAMSGRLLLTMKNSHHRLMAHSVSTFYNATSLSEFNDGVKVVMVTAPIQYTFTPSQRMVHFLKEERADVAYWKKPNVARPKKRCGMSFVPISEFSNEANVGWV